MWPWRCRPFFLCCCCCFCVCVITQVKAKQSISYGFFVAVWLGKIRFTLTCQIKRLSINRFNQLCRWGVVSPSRIFLSHGASQNTQTDNQWPHTLTGRIDQKNNNRMQIRGGWVNHMFAIGFSLRSQNMKNETYQSNGGSQSITSHSNSISKTREKYWSSIDYLILSVQGRESPWIHPTVCIHVSREFFLDFDKWNEALTAPSIIDASHK